MPFYSVSKITKCSIWPNCTSSLLESWIWLQQCRDLWELCWWWSGLFQFTEVTSAMMLQPTTWWGCLTKEHYWGHPRHAGGQWLYQIFCDENQWRFVFRGTQMYWSTDIFTAAFWCVLSGLWRTHCSGLDLAGGRTADKDCSIWLIKTREKVFF